MPSARVVRRLTSVKRHTVYHTKQHVPVNVVRSISSRVNIRTYIVNTLRESEIFYFNTCLRGLMSEEYQKDLTRTDLQ